jgi:hypothetical protein
MPVEESSEWSMPLMASALLGNRSIISLDLYRYVFPHANVSYVNSLLPSQSDLSNEQNKPTSSVDDTMNTHNHPALMQSLWQSPEMMNTSSFVEEPLLTRQLMALLYS